jgi:hypothetical protein
MKLQIVLDNNPNNIGLYKYKGKPVYRTYVIGVVENVTVQKGKIVALINYKPVDTPYTVKISTRTF